MPAHQKYSGRIHSKRQLGRAIEHAQAIALILGEVHDRYREALPMLSDACKTLLDILSMVENMLDELKDSL